MDLWRISNHASLTGEGGLRASGRWHTRGSRVVYCAQTPAAALLEILVHLEIELADLPARYRLLRVRAPDEIATQRLDASALPPDWPARIDTTRAIGDDWLERGMAALLIVPSAIVPHTANVLLNPVHADAARIEVAEITDHAIDPRLVK